MEAFDRRGRAACVQTGRGFFRRQREAALDQDGTGIYARLHTMPRDAMERLAVQHRPCGGAHSGIGGKRPVMVIDGSDARQCQSPCAKHVAIVDAEKNVEFLQG